MAPVCSICRSPDREVIDRDLVAGLEGTRAIAGRHRQHGRSSIERHGRVCLRLGPPSGRLYGLAVRAELASVALSGVQRAEELLDAAEAAQDRPGAASALGVLTRAITGAERLFPAAEPGFVSDEGVRSLLTVLARQLDDPAARETITDGLRGYGADDLADALETVWLAPSHALPATTAVAR